MTENQHRLATMKDRFRSSASICATRGDLLQMLDILEDGPQGAPSEAPPTTYRVEFRRVVCEKAFLKVNSASKDEARIWGSYLRPDDPSLKWEPVSATMEIESVKPE